MLAGANTVIRNADGKLAIELALEAGHRSTAAVLRSTDENLSRTAHALEVPQGVFTTPLRVCLTDLHESCLLWPGFDRMLARIWQNVHEVLRKVSPSYGAGAA
jgi:hypothetical protein